MCRCTTIRPGSVVFETDGKTGEAAQLLKVLSDTNRQISTIKGKGFVKIKQGNQVNRFRAIWAGSRPNKFRLEILAATLQPVLSFASDGGRHYLLSYSDNRLYQRKASKNGLKRLVSLAVTPEEILDLIIGRLPVNPDSRAALEYRGGGNVPVLILEAPKTKDQERIIFGGNEGAIFKEMESYDRRGRLKYRAIFEKMQEVEGVKIPERLTVSDDSGSMIQITVEKCWINSDIPEDRFVLKPPS